MIAGLVVYAGLPDEPQNWALLGMAIVLLAALGLARGSLRTWRSIALLIAGWLGFCLMPLHATIFGTPMLGAPVYGEFTAIVDEVLSASATDRRIIVSHVQASDPAQSVSIRRARIVTAPQPDLAPGDTIRASLRLAPVPGPVLPGGFDGQFHAFFDGIGAYGTVTGPLVLVANGQGFDPGRAIAGLRHDIGNRIDAVLDGEAAAIGWAMVVGDQSNITDETRDLMAAAGLAHIYSISGLHMSLVAGGMFVLVRLVLASLPGLTLAWPIKKIAALGGIITVGFYLLLAGGLANVPALRSTLMLGLVFGAVLAGRRALTMRNVALAAIAIILIDPASVFRASFQLSFAAVVALIGVYEAPRKAQTGSSGFFGWLGKVLWSTALTSLIAGSATLLFSAYHFQQTAPLGVIGNLLALPLVSLVIMPAAMLALLVMPFGFEGLFIRVMGLGIEWMLNVARLVADWSAGLHSNPLLTPGALLIGLVALAWFAFLEGRWRYVAPILALPAILILGLDTRADVLIADTTRATAVRSSGGMGLLSGKSDSFAVKVWHEHYQETIAAAVDSAHCDSAACIAMGDGFSVALVKTIEAFDEDCRHNDLVVTRLQAPANCRMQTTVIDRSDLARGGVQWLRWDEARKNFEIRAAIANVNRPWRVLPR